MLIDVISQNAERMLLSTIEQDKKRGILRGALHFHCSRLERKPKEEEILITVRPLLEDKQAAIYFFHDGDLLITWSGVQKVVLDDLCTRLYTNFRLTGKERFHSYYDFNAHGEDLRLLCRHKIEALMQPEKDMPPIPVPKSEFISIAFDASPDQLKLLQAAIKERKQRKKLEILVVEDQPFSRKLLLNLLGRIYKVYPAANVRTALELYLAIAPDIVFMDIELPEINGHELAAAINQLDSEAYIIMVSANNYIEDVTRAKKNGAKGFVIKPYNRQKIFEGIEKYIQERKSRL